MTIVEQICGTAPNDFEKLDISSNPDFVFEADSNFISRQIFDAEGNSVFVNSYIECEHYVSGGWDSNILNNIESNYQSFVAYFSFFTLVTILLI